MFSEAVNIWMQQVPVPGVDIFFYWITVLGSEFAYLFLVTTVLWCVDHRVGKRLLFAILLSTWINSVLKDALGMPRPSDEILRVMVDEWSAGFPSGHAQLAATFWGFLALCRRNRLMTIIAVSMVIMVSLSRLYLGVHYMYQVLGGIAVGVAVAWLAVRHPLSMAKSFQPKARHWLLGVLLPYLAALPVQSDDGFRIAGATMGLLLGEMTQHTQKDSGESLRPGQALGRLVLGWPTLILGYWLVSREYLAPGIASMLAYCALTMWITVGMPWVFGLARLGATPQAFSPCEEDPERKHPILADVPVPVRWSASTISWAAVVAFFALLAIGISLMALDTSEQPDADGIPLAESEVLHYLPELPLGPGPIVIGHQGAAGLAPGNTLAAFGQGLQAGSHILQLDVRRSLDRIPMVFAEENTESVTGVKGIVSDMSLVELRRLDAGYSFTVDGQAYPYRGKNVRIPTLEMVLTAYPTAYFYVNIKDRGEDAARDVLAVLDAAGARHRVIVVCDDGPTIRHFRTLAPEVPTGLAQDEIRRFFIMVRLGVGVFYRAPARYLLMPHRRGVIQLANPAHIRLAHRAGMKVHVGVVNNRQVMKQMIAAGADGILTDWPNHLTALLRE
ncbi:MAG: phosphatase PAP2 family protein [Firmicutes bacterium]|nr:phosphatase PAP2 family protein [Bacillota bacterium]